MKLVAALLAVFALPVAAQPGPNPQLIESYAACAERWATAHAGSIATAYEVADAAADACPDDRPGALLAGMIASDNPAIHRLRAYARARALRAVVVARLPLPLK